MKVLGWFKRFRRKQDLKLGLRLIYTDKHGVRYYEYENAPSVPYARWIAAETATRQAEFCLTRDHFLRLLEQAEGFANKGDIVSLFAVLGEVKTCAHFAAEEKTMLELAACYYLHQDEDPTTYLPAWGARKVEAWKNDPDALSFFCVRAYRHTRDCVDTSDRDILNFIEMARKHLERLPHILATASPPSSTN